MSGALPPPEFSRLVDVRHLSGKPLELSAEPQEREALAARFDLVSVNSLDATVALDRQGERVDAKGRMIARIVQSCAVSGEDLPVTIDHEIAFRFVHPGPQGAAADEIELDADDCDEIEYDGHSFDLGEAIAQSLGLAIDPFLEGPQADAARREAGILSEGAGGAFAGLSALLKPKPD
ncbi:YceD family protein [Novosphingobium tardum]|uniref:YceD family protein n=1 Tax=Novosphingobium tardum TaxID=1538021 RepID=A0ABV8RNL9_9SPHN